MRTHWSQKDKYGLIALVSGTQSRQSHRDRTVVARGWEEGDRELLHNGNRVFFLQDGSSSVDGWWGLHDTNVLNATELHLERIKMTNFTVHGSYHNENKR